MTFGRVKSLALCVASLSMFGCGAVDLPTMPPASPAPTATLASTLPPTAGLPDQTVPPELAGSLLAFSREDGVYVARADGTDLRRVSDIEEFEYQPDWSPDGQRLLLRVDPAQGPGAVWLVGADGSQPTNLSEISGIPGGSPDWSPNGEQVVFVGHRPGDRYFNLWLMNADGSDPRRLTPDEWEAQYPAWSPDGSLIAFTRVVPARGSFEIWTIDPDGSGLRRLGDQEGRDNYSAWSPEGDRLVFHSSSRAAAPDGLYVMQRDGAGRRFLAEGGEPNWDPGDWIAYDCAHSVEGAICVVNPDDGRSAELPLGASGFPAWAPE